MQLQLTQSQRGKQEHCRCPRNPRILTPKRTTPKESLSVLVAFLAIMAILAVFFVEIVVFILGVWLAGAVLGIAWRLVRGHTVSCAVTWGSTDILYTVLGSASYAWF